MTDHRNLLLAQDLVKDFKPSRSFAASHHDSLTPRGMIRAVDGISFSALAGQVTVLLGTNGAGKTTSLSCAQGLIKPDGGSVQVLGQNPLNASDELRARVGIMLQDGGLPLSIRPSSLLKHLSKMYAKPVDLADLMRRLEIDSFDGTIIRRLSGGQKQKVALAAALLGRPEVLFLDEPTAGMDPQTRQTVFELIEEEKDRGTAIILTTHLLDDAQRLADYVYIVHKGRNRADGTVSSLLENFASGSVFSFTIPQPDLGIAELLPGRESCLELTEPSPGSYVLSGQIDSLVLAELTQEFVRRGITPSRFGLAQRTLEDLFLDIAGESQ